MKIHIQGYIRVAYTLAFLCGVVSLQLQAETVALWKLDYSPYTGLNTRCLVDPANDFDVVIQGQQKEPPSTRPPLPAGMSQQWSPLPPNPDLTADLLDTTASTNAILYTHGILFSSPGVTPAINSLTNSFTVEGWHYQDAYAAPPGIGQYQAFFALGRTYYPGGWSCGYYNQDDTNNLHFAIFDYNYANGTAQRVFPTPVAKDTYYLKWCHYALVYDAEGGGGLGTWQIFVNSSSYGVITNQTLPTAAGTQTNFYLGGDAYNSQYFNRGGYDYWRISDQALATNQLLNAGVAMTVTSPKTLAFYRLDVNGDNSFDFSNRVANAHHLQSAPVDTYTQVSTNAAQAVASVPNPDQSDHFLGRRSLNKGSIAFRTGSTAGKDSYLITSDGLGYQLGTNTAWTIETWINFTALSSRQVIFDVKSNVGLATGWMFLNYNGLASRYCLFIGSPPGTFLGFPGSTGGSSETSLNAWHHLALTFDPAAGPGYLGKWECFLDSRSLGTIAYSNSYQRVNSSENLCVGGRGSAFGDSVYGSMDLVRVSDAILATNQFLNAGGYVATTNALATTAYWKLDSDGVTPDTTSQVDTRYSLSSATAVAPVAGSTDRCRAIILNPDTTSGFIGNPTANLGSVLMTNATALTVGNLGNQMELDTAFTVEGWMKWESNASRDIQALAGTRFDTDSGWLLPPVGPANRVLFEVPSGWLLTLEKRGADVAFHIACNTIVTNIFTASDTVVDADLATLPLSAVAGSWHHVALTYEPDVADVGRWTLFIDGVEQGAVDNAVTPFYNTGSHRFLLGGQASGTTSFDGNLDSWRVTGGVLDPAQMLYVKVFGGTIILVK
jgi:hypothetical protein